MFTTKTSTIAIAGAALITAGLTGYLFSEIRHGDVNPPVVEAVAEASAAAAPAAAPESGLEEAPAQGAVAVPSASVAARPQSVPARRTEPASPPEPPAAGTNPAEAQAPPRAEPAPSMTSAAPMVLDPTPVAVLGATPIPGLEPPVDRIELVVERDAVIGVRLDEAVSSETAKVEDRVSAVVTRDVIVEGLTAIPAGSRAEGYVTFVERGGKFREKARIGVEFSSLVLPGGEVVPIATEAIYRDGESPVGEATSKIGASAVVGTVLGAIIGGKKGAAIGGAAGAAGGTAVVAKGGVNDAVLAAGTSLTLRLTAPVVRIVERR